MRGTFDVSQQPDSPCVKAKCENCGGKYYGLTYTVKGKNKK